MSENLDLVRSIFVAWEQGKFGSVEWAHPDIEYAVVDEPGAGTLEGVVAMGNAWRQFLSAWDQYRVEAQEYRELDGERVLVLVHAWGRGKTSGVELDEMTRGRGANLFHIRDRKVIRLHAYFDHRRALADLGLAE